MSDAIVALQTQVMQLERADTEQWTMLDALRDRLPNWVVFLLSGGAGVIGFLVHWLVSCLK